MLTTRPPKPSSWDKCVINVRQGRYMILTVSVESARKVIFEIHKNITNPVLLFDF